MSNASTSAENLTATTIVNLKTQDMFNPAGIGSVAPSFSWQMESDVIGAETDSFSK